VFRLALSSLIFIVRKEGPPAAWWAVASGRRQRSTGRWDEALGGQRLEV